MADLVIYNHIIQPDINSILNKVKKETEGHKLDYIGPIRNNNIKIVCPFHNDTNPSCFVYASNEGDTVFGTAHCFSCGTKASLPRLVNRLYGLSDGAEFGKQWLIDNFSNTFLEQSILLPEIELPNTKRRQYMNEDILKQYRYIHPYILGRGISPEVVRLFEVGWNPQTDSITFPVRDEHGGLIGITERSVNTKRFHIPEGLNKPVYLLYFVLRKGLTEVYVCESQINALTLWSWGIPAVALIGTGTTEQYRILKKSGIRNYHLCFDGDNAGRKGASKFIKAMKKDCLIDTVEIPEGKDVNDLTKDQFVNLWRR